MAEKTPLEQLEEDRGAPLSEAQREQSRELEQEYEDQKPLEGPDKSPKAVHIEEDHEKGQLQELNAEFLNDRLGKYIEGVHKQETEWVEKKYGKGLWGRIKRWFEETDWGKAIKVGAKVVGGSVAVGAMLLGTGGLATPLLGALGGRAAVDGVLEGIQYLRERGTIQTIRQARGGRMASILELASVRNRVLEQPGRSAQMAENIDGENLGTMLEQLITNTADQERRIIEGESNLARSQKWWKLGRFAAGLVTVGATAAYAGLYGIKMGVQDFDKIHELATQPGAADWIKNMATGMAPSHEVKLYLNGVQFMYNQAEITTFNVVNGGALHHAPGVIGHYLGPNAPWGQIYASAFGALAGLTGAATKEILSDFPHLNKLSKEEIKAAVFSLRKESRPDLAGAGQEIAVEPITDASKLWKGLGEAEVWSFKGGPNNPDPNGPERWYVVKKNVDRGEVNLVEIDKDTGKEIIGFVPIVKGRGDLYTLLQANKHIFKKEGASFAEIEAKRKAEEKEKVEKFVKDKGLEEGKLIRPKRDIKIGTETLKSGVEYTVIQLNLDDGTAVLVGKETVLGKKRLVQHPIKLAQMIGQRNNIYVLVPEEKESAGETSAEEGDKTGQEKLNEALKRKRRIPEKVGDFNQKQVWKYGGEHYRIDDFFADGTVLAKKIEPDDNGVDIISGDDPIEIPLRNFVDRARFYRAKVNEPQPRGQKQQGKQKQQGQQQPQTT